MACPQQYVSIFLLCPTGYQTTFQVWIQNDPATGVPAIPAGQVFSGELIARAVPRVVQQQTGLQISSCRFRPIGCPVECCAGGQTVAAFFFFAILTAQEVPARDVPAIGSVWYLFQLTKTPWQIGVTRQTLVKAQELWLSFKRPPRQPPMRYLVPKTVGGVAVPAVRVPVAAPGCLGDF